MCTNLWTHEHVMTRSKVYEFAILYGVPDIQFTYKAAPVWAWNKRAERISLTGLPRNIRKIDCLEASGASKPYIGTITKTL